MEKKIVFIPSIDRVYYGSDGQEKKLDFLHGSVRRYKPLTSSTNCGCGHLMLHFLGIAISQQFIDCSSIYIARWGPLLIVVPADSGACSRSSCCSTTSCLDLRVIRAL